MNSPQQCVTYAFLRIRVNIVDDISAGFPNGRNIGSDDRGATGKSLQWRKTESFVKRREGEGRCAARDFPKSIERDFTRTVDPPGNQTFNGIPVHTVDEPLFFTCKDKVVGNLARDICKGETEGKEVFVRLEIAYGKEVRKWEHVFL